MTVSSDTQLRKKVEYSLDSCDYVKSRFGQELQMKHNGKKDSKIVFLFASMNVIWQTAKMLNHIAPFFNAVQWCHI